MRILILGLQDMFSHLQYDCVRGYNGLYNVGVSTHLYKHIHVHTCTQSACIFPTSKTLRPASVLMTC